MQDVFVQQTTLTVPASHAEHGEDYVIEWQDPVMEKHVRKWLDRPKGDIYHSDVWDYQRVSINSGTGVGDLIVKDAPDGVDIGRNVNSNEQLAACAVSVEGTYDPVTSLADLRHFDSLQVLSVNNRRGAPPITDLTGLEECKNLMLLSVPSVESSAFPTFAKLDSVVKLEYGSNGLRAEANVSDLSALAQMKSLEMLRIIGSEVDLNQLAGADLRTLTLDVTRIGSLEPLKQMENLRVLQLQNGPEIDSFAPLAETNVQYLSMSLSEGSQGNYKDMDYTPLTQMPQLIWLDLTFHSTFDAETCKKLLANDTALKYLDISYTPAAKEAENLDTERLKEYIAPAP
ncbi:leucine-rich repeat domain-containing protein [Faecalibacterium prausnitzii]|uniref:leucine-rich repeat domain-containing protein n=1 Tax=Faecalibacterium prausnitzii TaxID=853 RepID=UPI0012DD75BA|nr:leucine-rich repeat domain-containing protein [Faecalibacterium prausnitzii]